MADAPPPSGPSVYDDVLRALAVDELVALCRWLGIDTDAGSVRPRQALPSLAQDAGLLVGAGPGRLAQVGLVRRPTPDLAHRLLEHRARVMRREPDRLLRQHVLVLAEGHLDLELTDGTEFWTRFHVTYLRDVDPEELLRSPALAPLASLGRPPRPEARAEILRRALVVIRTGAPPARAARLAEIAAVLAAIHLDATTIDAIGSPDG